MENLSQEAPRPFVSSNPFSNVPYSSKILSISLIFFFLIGLLIPSSQNVIALIPGYTIPPHFYVWNIFTSGFFEISFVAVIVDVLCLSIFGKYLEPMWGSREYLKFILLINLFCGISIFSLMVVFFFISGGETTAWFTPRCGFAGVLSGFSIGLKQLIPEQDMLGNLLEFSLRAKHFPIILLAYNLFFFLVGLSSESFLHSFFGIIVSWVYLRFYQKREGSVGDRSESFSFASFFPEPLQPSMRIASNVTFNILKLLRICKDLDSSSTDSTSQGPIDLVSERRRARALKTLDQRMQLMKATNQTDIVQAREVEMQQV